MSTTSADQPSAHVVTITIHVNEKRVVLHNREPTGLEIKEAAIAQGVEIETDFILVEELPNRRTKQIGDSDTVKINDESRFTATDDDDDS